MQGAAKAKAVVQSLSLVIERGEVFGLLGPNGAGKTTAIRLMTGFLEPGQPARPLVFGRMSCVCSLGSNRGDHII